jgi:hypothetical protein
VVLTTDTKNRLESRVFLAEDKLVERLQLCANVETLIKRGENAIKKDQLGSAKQCLEKAIGALAAQPNPDEYITTKKAILEEQLDNIEVNLKTTNILDVAKKENPKKAVLTNCLRTRKKW